jgi:hypothetical protein
MSYGISHCITAGLWVLAGAQEWRPVVIWTEKSKDTNFNGEMKRSLNRAGLHTFKMQPITTMTFFNLRPPQITDNCNGHLSRNSRHLNSWTGAATYMADILCECPENPLKQHLVSAERTPNARRTHAQHSLPWLAEPCWEWTQISTFLPTVCIY